MNPYRDFVKSIQAGIESAKGLSVSGTTEPTASDSKVLLFSPHPDDECITGLLPLRLMRETGRQVISVSVTFGSKAERQAARAAELADACGYLGWSIARGRKDYQALSVDEVVGVLKQFSPDIIFFPHAEDWNSRHVFTHHLLVDALHRMGEGFSCTVVETEYWGAMDDPNLMVEGDAETVADLVAATSLHGGEVARNPYHLLLPAWMQDNVRRGGELVGGQGEAAPQFDFATLYRLRRWEQGGFVPVLQKGMVIPKTSSSLKEVFGWK